MAQGDEGDRRGRRGASENVGGGKNGSRSRERAWFITRYGCAPYELLYGATTAVTGFSSRLGFSSSRLGFSSRLGISRSLDLASAAGPASAAGLTSTAGLASAAGLA
jgi:hypothetical protein